MTAPPEHVFATILAAWRAPTLKRRLLVAVALIVVSAVGALAQVAHDAAAHPEASVWASLLTPQTITTLVVVLLYLGSLKQDLQTLKQDVGALKNWRDELPRELEEKFMSREVADERHAGLVARFKRRES